MTEDLKTKVFPQMNFPSMRYGPLCYHYHSATFTGNDEILKVAADSVLKFLTTLLKVSLFAKDANAYLLRDNRRNIEGTSESLKIEISEPIRTNCFIRFSSDHEFFDIHIITKIVFCEKKSEKAFKSKSTKTTDVVLSISF